MADCQQHCAKVPDPLLSSKPGFTMGWADRPDLSSSGLGQEFLMAGGTVEP